MKLLGVAIIGKSNEPLYLCDCTKITDRATAKPSTEASNDDDEKKNSDDDDDYFGFGLTSRTVAATAPQGQSLSMEHQLMIHASLDRLEEMVGASKPDGTMPLRRSNSAYSAWLGLLTVLDGQWSIYGHVAATNIKFLALCEADATLSDGGTWLTTTTARSGAVNNNSNAASGPPSTKSHEHRIKTMLSSIHRHFVNYTMNPFCDLTEPIRSATFDKHVKHEIAQFCDLDESSHHPPKTDTTRPAAAQEVAA